MKKILSVALALTVVISCYSIVSANVDVPSVGLESTDNYEDLSQLTNFVENPDLAMSRKIAALGYSPWMNFNNITPFATSSSIYGAAWAYTKTSSTAYNCYGYAARFYWRINPGDITYYNGALGANPTQAIIKNYFTVSNIANCVISDLKRSGRSARIIDNGLSTISSSEYRIAVRTGVHDYNKNGKIDLANNEADYHFMLQHNDGSWSSKPGLSPTVNLGPISPRQASWNLGSKVNYYNSATIYIAVKK